MPYNSTIKQKMGECIDCNDGQEKPLTAGRCNFHYKNHRTKINNSKQKFQTDIRKLIVRYNDRDLPIWFNDKIQLLKFNPVCSECGAKISDRYVENGVEIFTDKFFKAAVAHIFPKSIFLSVAVHPLNYIFAGAGCGCHNLTHRMDTFSKMKIFPVAVTRFLQFSGEITENHKYKTLFIEAAQNYINT